MPVDANTLSPVPNGHKAHHQYVTFSVPAALMQGHAPSAVRVQGSDQTLPLQTRPLGSPAASPRWWFCEAMAPRGSQLIVLTKNATPVATPVATAATAQLQDDGSVILRNEHLQLQLSQSASSPIAAILYQGRPVHIDNPLALIYQSQGQTYDVANDPSRQIQITATGPVRAAVQITGRHTGPKQQPGLNYRLRIELLAGLPVIVISYWFFHCLPGVEELVIDDMQLSLALKTTDNLKHFRQLKHGLTGVPRQVTTAHPLDARVGHDQAVHWRLSNAVALEDDTDYPPYAMPPCDEISTWLGTNLTDCWSAAAMDDVCDMQPKALRLERGRYDLAIWPDWAKPMRLPQGRSRQITFRIVFGDTASDKNNKPLSPDASHVESVLQASRGDSPLLFGPHAYAAAGVFDQKHLLKNDGVHERFDTYLGKVACPPTVADMFDLGDTPDPGYQTTYLRTGRRLEHIVPHASQRPVQFLTGGRAQCVAPWSDITQFEPIWANNEYDVIWTIGGEVMRASRHDLLPSLRWFARHAIEVDFVHYSDHRVKHRATPPHCARHTTAGAYPSHFWTQGVLQYYALTGDEDALEFARAIGDKIVEMFGDPDIRAKLWHPTRELGWALLALASLIEFDPAPRYMTLAQEMADDLIAAPLTDEFIENAVKYAFGYASIVLGVDRWHDVQPQQRHRDWLVRFAQQCGPRMACLPGIELAMGLCILHAGYKHSGDASLVRHGMRVLERVIDSKVWVDPSPYTKPFALLHRPLSRFFADAASTGLLNKLDYQF